MVFVLFCQTSSDTSCQPHCCLKIPTHPTAHMSSSIATSTDKRYLYLYLWDKIETLYNHTPFVYNAGQNHAYSQLQSSLYHNSFHFLCVCECPRTCLFDKLILGYLTISLLIQINILKIYYFIFVVGRRLTSDPNALWLHMGLLYQPQMVNKCGTVINSYITGRANTNCMGPISFPLCPSRVWRGLPWEWTCVSSVTSWQHPGQMSVTVHLIVNIWVWCIYKYIKLLVSWYFTFSVQLVYTKKFYYQQTAQQISLTHR